MRGMRLGSSGIVLAALALACTSAQENEQAQAAEEQAATAAVATPTEAEIKATYDEWLAAEKSDDGARAGGLYAADAVFVSARGKVEGKDAITKFWTDVFNEKPGSSGTEIHPMKWGASGELGWSLIHYTGGVTAPGASGHALAVSQRQPDGSLKLLVQVSIPEPAPKPQK